MTQEIIHKLIIGLSFKPKFQKFEFSIFFEFQFFFNFKIVGTISILE